MKAVVCPSPSNGTIESKETNKTNDNSSSGTKHPVDDDEEEEVTVSESDDENEDDDDASTAPEAPPRTRRKSEAVPNLEEVVLVEHTVQKPRSFIPVVIYKYL